MPERHETIPFEGLSTRFIVLAGAGLGIPILLHVVGVFDARITGALFGGASMLLALGLAGWSAVGGTDRRGVTIAAVGIAAGVAGVAGLPLLRAIFPGNAVASVVLSRVGDEKSLEGLRPGGTYDLMVHADIGVAQEVHAGYRLTLTSGGVAQELTGRFESQRGRGRVGRTTVSVVRPPPEWTRHTVQVESAPHRVRLASRQGALGSDLRVSMHEVLPLWPFVAAAGALLAGAAALAARFPGRLRRHFFVATIAFAGGTGLLGGHWAWIGAPFYPVLGAAFLSLVGGWLVGKLLARAVDSLPWAAR